MITANIRNYQSQSVGGDDIELNLTELDLNTTEIIVYNLHFKHKRNTAIKYLLFLSLLLGCILPFKSIILVAAVIVFISIRFYCFACLVEYGIKTN